MILSVSYSYYIFLNGLKRRQSDMDFNRVLNDLGNCCLTESVCGNCSKPDCIVGYATKSITKCLKDDVIYVVDGQQNIPFFDLKMYDEETFIKGIAHILKMCKSCSENHFDNCIINIVRNCYEIGLFGEIQSYEGSNFRYLAQIHNSKPDIAVRIIDEFHNC